MSEAPSLDFGRTDFQNPGQATAPACGGCSLPLNGSFYTLAEQVLCERCHFDARETGPPGSMLSRPLGALTLGSVAAVIAGLLWLAVTELTGYEIGLIAIVVGLLVGGAVKVGSRGVGGLGYQMIAVFLTYSAIVMTYVPQIVSELRADEVIMAELESAATDPTGVEGSDAGDASPVVDEGAITATLVMFSIPLAYAAPFLLGLENLIGLLIIGFALYEAWKLNKPANLEMKGPFRLGVDEAPATS